VAQKDATNLSAPDDHFAAGPQCRMARPGMRRVGDAGGCPAVGAGVVPPAGVHIGRAVTPTPDDHLAASPNSRASRPRSGRVGGAGGGPVIVAASGPIRY